MFLLMYWNTCWECTVQSMTKKRLRSGLEKIKRILSENYVRPDQSDYVKSKIKENGQYTVIDKVTVRLDEKEDKYIASFTNLDLKDFEVNSDLSPNNEKLLVGGLVYLKSNMWDWNEILTKMITKKIFLTAIKRNGIRNRKRKNPDTTPLFQSLL